MKKIEKEITCGPENIDSFKKELSTALPGALPFFKHAYSAGLIVGLRGAKLAYFSDQDSQGVDVAPQTEKQPLYCRDCISYQPDPVGDGSGVGSCLKNIITRQTKWPLTDACEHIEVIA